MRWSIKIAQVSGIPIRIHVTFFLLFVWVAFASAQRGAPVLPNLVFVSLVFVCVVLHELGHSLVAQRYGIRVQDITLLPIGGLARLERMPEKPSQEFWVAVAGPAVNVAIALLLFVVLRVRGDGGGAASPYLFRAGLLESLLLANVVLVLFNLLPAFPMDGGRVLRALLAQRLGFFRATQIAARVGQGMALLFVVWGFAGGNPLLFLIALFVYMGAEQEASLAQMRAALQNVPVLSAMVTDIRTCAPDDEVAVVVRQLLSGHQQDFPVVVGDRVVGIVTRADLLKALAERGPGVPVAEIMRTDVEPVDPYDALDRVIGQMQAGGWPMVPVVYGGRLVGLLTLENLSEFLMVRSALKGRPANLERVVV